MKNILKIIRISKPLHGIVAIIGLLIVTSSILELIPPILSKFIVDEIVLQLQTAEGNFQKLIYLILLTFILGLISQVITTATERLGDHFAGTLRKFLTEKFYDKILTFPQSYFDSEISGKIIHQLNRALFTIQNFINGSTNFILPTFLQSIFTIAILAYYNIPIAVLVAILFPIYLSLSYYSTKRWGEREVKKNYYEDISRARITEVVSNIKLVKTSLAENRELNFISDNLNKFNKIFAHQSWTFHKFDFARNLSLIIILLGVNIVAFINTFNGAITIGTLVLILQLVNQARRPLFAMSFILTNLQQAESGSKEYFEILDLKGTENYKLDSKVEKLKNPNIEFKKVSFSYEKGQQVLKNVSFKCLSGDKIALVGHSGTGKTTVVNLILKLYEPTAGNIYLNGKKYKDLTHHFVRNNISLVFQDAELFSSTVAKNVTYAKPNTGKNQIVEALKLANAWEFVNRLPKGINSEIGERGVKLSGGQKQRIQIARAILEDSPILILDEATSSLDAKNEKEVQEGLENLMRDKLVIIVAHRFSTIQNVEKIIVIDEGKVTDIGSPQTLSKKKGIYSELLRYQIEGNKKLLEKFEIY
ncbi:hypothetical protein A3J17_02320 [Candidatus Curtissbacteria bacterium RIFCSPLOWO2_02_FULL_40_11]|nr:MAG: hypothetical protein A3J17_02320 [Candidatus Curtissbacteria bacterium RIFCSPLOWO2_02_FULL_40_11]